MSQSAVVPITIKRAFLLPTMEDKYFNNITLNQQLKYFTRNGLKIICIHLLSCGHLIFGI
jgi:hypothetical protein